MMGDINLIIKISEDVYTRLFDNGIQDNEIAVDDVCEMARALRLGTPLEQQPCEDCISREAVEKVTWEEPSYDDALNVLTEVRDKVRALPSVKPKFTDEEIQKMQELEQAQLDKTYELGKAESFEEWLSSFNTESATCCFTAVQQLQEKLNGKMD